MNRAGKVFSRFRAAPIHRVGLAALILGLSAPIAALPPSLPAPAEMVRSGEPVASIPAAGGVSAYQPLDGEHVMLESGDDRYVLTLNRECVGLRWARHVGVTVSDNGIWAGFDALTADGRACPIREIHRLTDEL
jgi:hypothetical protein